MLHDLQYALRAYLRTPGFTLVAVLTLALGIGATTAIFSIVNAVLLKPLPYADAERLAVARLSLPDYQDLKASSQSFDDIAVWASNRYNLRSDGESRQVLGGVISPNLLTLLGVNPALGHNFSAADERQETVILGYGLWQSQYGGDPAILGRAIELSGTPHTVVGVAPAWFRFPSAEFQLWTSIGVMEARAPAQVRNRALRIFNALGRLRRTVTMQQAQAEVSAISEQLARTHPTTNEQITIEFVPLYERLVGEARRPLAVLLVAVGLLLLIACANVANLLLVRTSAREREMAVRAALGAARGRLVRQVAVESCVLAAAGGVLGLLVAMWGVDGLPAILEARLPRAEAIAVDPAVLIFALAATMMSAVFFGLAPALQMSAVPGEALKAGGRSEAGTARGRRARRAIVVSEIALAVIVLVGAGLLARSFFSMLARDPGFRAENVLSFNVQFLKQPDAPARAQKAAELIDRLAALPGVVAAGGATGLPPVTAQRGTRFEIEARPLTPDESGAYFIAATPEYFRAIGTDVLRGRTFERADRAGAQPAAVINRTLAERLFPGRDPIGQRLRLVNPEFSSEWRTIVGVVADVQYQGLDGQAQPTIYTPFDQTPFPWLYVMVRTTQGSDALARSIRSVVPTVDPTLTAADARPLDEVASSTVAEPRFNALLISSFAMLALILAGIGIYGVIAFSVAQRTREIGIRMALGAASSDVLLLVLREGVLIAVAGVALGLAGAALATRLMESLLFGVAARDPLTFGGGAALLLAIALAASYLPARRAARVEPVVALRAE